MITLKTTTAAIALGALAVFGTASVATAAPAAPTSVDPKPCC